MHDYLQRAEAAGIKYGFDDSRLEAALFRQATATMPLRKAPPDCAAIHEQLHKPHMTLQLL